MPGGQGPAPKPEDRRARRTQTAKQAALPIRTIEHTPAEPPALPDLPDIEWHPQTLRWWSNWINTPLSADFGDTDWDFLLDTALMHNAMWTKGRWELAAEVRLRVAKFGATPEDRARLRIVFATANSKENRPDTPSEGAEGAPASPSRARYGRPQLVPPPS